MSGWTAVLLHDGDEVLRSPAHVEDVASIAAPVLVAVFGGPISVGSVLVGLRETEGQLALDYEAAS